MTLHLFSYEAQYISYFFFEKNKFSKKTIIIKEKRRKCKTFNFANQNDPEQSCQIS